MQPSLATKPHNLTKPVYSRKLKGNNHGLTQAYEIRDIAASHALELREEPAETLQDKALRARALKDNVCVWEIAATRIRICKGQPLPGSLRPERKPSKKRTVNLAPTEEPINPAQAKVSSPAKGSDILSSSDGTSS